MNKINLYVDMDGVLSDFDKGYYDVFGVSTSHVRKHNRKDYWAMWDIFLDREGFANLQLFPGAQKLIDKINSLSSRIQPCIMSSAGGFYRQRTVMRQKLEWLDKYNIKWPAVIVPGKVFKKGFANANSIIIDDTHEVITMFVMAGGHAIHHTGDVDKVISQLDIAINDTIHEMDRKMVDV